MSYPTQNHLKHIKSVFTSYSVKDTLNFALQADNMSDNKVAYVTYL